eukprot:759319-Hanusia_phi.AAC.1
MIIAPLPDRMDAGLVAAQREGMGGKEIVLRYVQTPYPHQGLSVKRRERVDNLAVRTWFLACRRFGGLQKSMVSGFAEEAPERAIGMCSSDEKWEEIDVGSGRKEGKSRVEGEEEEEEEEEAREACAIPTPSAITSAITGMCMAPDTSECEWG